MKIFKALISLLAFITFVGAIALGVVLFRPGLVLNKKTVKFALNKSGLFEDWSWKSAQIETEYIDFNTRRLKGKFKDFCFKYASGGNKAWGCLETLSWDLTAHITFSGIRLERPSPLVIDSRLINIELAPSKPVKQAQEKDSVPPDIYGLWQTVWAEYAPDLYLNIDKIKIKTEKGQKELGLNIKKLKNNLKASSLGLSLHASPEGFEILAPKKLKLPAEVPFLGPVIVYHAKVRGSISEEVLAASLRAESFGASFKAKTSIGLPLNNPPGEWRFLKEIALNTEADVEIQNFKKSYKEHVKEPYNVLPAPLNVLDGKARLKVRTREALTQEEIEVVAQLLMDMEGGEQELEFQIDGKGIVDLKKLRPGAIFIGGELYKVVLQIPHLPKTSLPPQFFPDGRIHREKKAFHQSLAHRPKKEAKLDLNMRIKAQREKSLSFKTNLLTSPLRLNTDLKIMKGELASGYVKALPFRTEFFNRDLKLEKFVIDFDDPKNPEVEGQILFDLPEYKVTLTLQGPLSSPRHALSSEPALPEEDIYSVLLFGRPMIDLEGGDRDAAERTNQVLSQGILSIGVLYYLSDTPIQAIIYDPDSEKVQAQIGISEKASLTVGAGSVGVRQSLGNGWYVDTNKNTDQGYGLMLERIIAY